MVSETRQQQIEGMADYVGERLKQILRESTKSCVQCDNFEIRLEVCKLNNLRPPAPIIAFGCECFVDIIPF